MTSRTRLLLLVAVVLPAVGGLALLGGLVLVLKPRLDRARSERESGEKVDVARQKAQQLLLFLKTHEIRHPEDFDVEGQFQGDIRVLSQYAEDGPRAVFDPWDTDGTRKFQVQYMRDPGRPDHLRAFVYTTRPNGGPLIGAPQELEKIANGQ